MVYKTPEQGFSAFDFLGSGYFTMQQFIDSVVISKLKIPKELVREWLLREKFFASEQSITVFELFK